MEEVEEGEVFAITIGNLPPLAKCIIKIIYVTELMVAGDAVVMVIPQVSFEWMKKKRDR